MLIREWDSCNSIYGVVRDCMSNSLISLPIPHMCKTFICTYIRGIHHGILTTSILLMVLLQGFSWFNLLLFSYETIFFTCLIASRVLVVLVLIAFFVLIYWSHVKCVLKLYLLEGKVTLRGKFNDCFDEFDVSKPQLSTDIDLKRKTLLCYSRV